MRAHRSTERHRIDQRLGRALAALAGVRQHRVGRVPEQRDDALAPERHRVAVEDRRHACRWPGCHRPNHSSKRGDMCLRIATGSSRPPGAASASASKSAVTPPDAERLSSGHPSPPGGNVRTHHHGGVHPAHLAPRRPQSTRTCPLGDDASTGAGHRLSWPILGNSHPFPNDDSRVTSLANSYNVRLSILTWP